MSAKKLISIFLILIAIFCAAKVYLYKQQLKDAINSDKELSNNYFRTSNINTFFGKKDNVSSGSIIETHDRTKDRHNVPYININADIKNLTGDDIEEAELTPILYVYFKNGEKTLSLFRYYIILPNEMWKNGETIHINHDFLLTSTANFNPKILEHQPEKIELNLYLKASNSVGLNIDELIDSKKIESW